MYILGEPLFSRQDNGRLESCVATLFLHTPGLVTKRGVHASQRNAWIAHLNEMRAMESKPQLTSAEEDLELDESVDLVVGDGVVMIRPDPSRMDLAMRADEALQTLVSKRQIRFLNTHSAKVRGVLRARGENWRMASAPISRDDMFTLVWDARILVEGEPVCYYNGSTGTRYLTVGGCEGLSTLPGDEARRQFRMLQKLLMARNHHGLPTLELFPPTTPIDIKQKLLAIDVEDVSDHVFRETVRRIYTAWRMSIPEELREESESNDAWLNAMCRVLTSCIVETGVDEDELVEGLSPEFHRQIQWLPGVRLENGAVTFDSLWDEYDRTHAPALAELCDERARNIIFNVLRVFSDIEYINVGRLILSLGRNGRSTRKGSVYLFQVKQRNKAEPGVYVLRFQDWGIAERLDDGKSLSAAIREAVAHTDGIMDRRLMCLQLGMNLPAHVGHGRYSLAYQGKNGEYRGQIITQTYFIREYVPGTVSSRIPLARFRNPLFAIRFAELMGAAAAVDLVTGRVSSGTKNPVFDTDYEIVQTNAEGVPTAVAVTDHAGTFGDVSTPLTTLVRAYAGVIAHRAKAVPNPESFAVHYVDAFRNRLLELQARYRRSQALFNDLFKHRAHLGTATEQWWKALARLDRCNVSEVAHELARSIRHGVKG